MTEIKFNPPWEGPPLSRQSQVYEPGGYRISPSDAKELILLVRGVIEDEQKAAGYYHELSERAYNMGKADISAFLEKMAMDEHHHYLSLKAMEEELSTIIWR
jgi:rubrerythrin